MIIRRWVNGRTVERLTKKIGSVVENCFVLVVNPGRGGVLFFCYNLFNLLPFFVLVRVFRGEISFFCVFRVLRG